MVATESGHTMKIFQTFLFLLFAAAIMSGCSLIYEFGEKTYPDGEVDVDDDAADVEQEDGKTDLDAQDDEVTEVVEDPVDDGEQDMEVAEDGVEDPVDEDISEEVPEDVPCEDAAEDPIEEDPAEEDPAEDPGEEDPVEDIADAEEEAYCGDGETDAGEECDDGRNGDPDDGCTDDCLYSCHFGSDCDDENDCTDDRCIEHICMNPPCCDGENCTDNNPCTDSDTCNDSGECIGTPVYLNDVTDVSTDGNTTCAIVESILKCWGFGGYGKLGNGSSTDRYTPVNVSGLSGLVSFVSVGGSHVCAQIASGGLMCWGLNNKGQLGDDTTVTRTTPVDVNDITGTNPFDAGSNHTCAIDVDGSAKCWGLNDKGQLGDATTTDKPVPTQVAGLASGVIDISAGNEHSCAVTSAGAVLCWGANNHGQLGDDSETDRLSPVSVNGLSSGVMEVTAGHFHTCALLRHGRREMLGKGQQRTAGQQLSIEQGHSRGRRGARFRGYGQVGDGSKTNWCSPTNVSGLGASSGVTAISPGYFHTCAVVGGGAKCWGRNNLGQVGNGTTEEALTPDDVTGLSSGVDTLSSGENHTCALLDDGSVDCWGSDMHGAVTGLFPGFPQYVTCSP